MPKTNLNSTDLMNGWIDRAENYARREPGKAVISAFGTGIILNMLPLRSIAAAAVGIAMYSVRPALLVLGLVKACEFCSNQTQSTKSHE